MSDDRHQVSWQREFGQVEDPQGASGLTTLLHAAETGFNGRSPVGNLTRSKMGRLGWLLLWRRWCWCRAD